MSAGVRINGRDLQAAFGFRVAGLPKFTAGPSRTASLTALYGRAGGVVGALTMAARMLPIAGTFVHTTLAAREAAEDQLKDLLFNEGLVTIEVESLSGWERQVDGLLEGDAGLDPTSPRLRRQTGTADLRFLCPDAPWRAPAGSAVSIAAANTRYAVELGTAPSSPIVRFMGAATNPIFTIRDSGGTAQVTIAITLTLAATNDWLELNCETGLIWKSVSGTLSRAESVLTSGTFPFNIDPAWGAYATSQWPRVEVSAGTAEVLYTKRYW